MLQQIDLNIETTEQLINHARLLRDEQLNCDYGHCRYVATALVITAGEARPACASHTTRMVGHARASHLTSIVINRANVL